MAFNGSGTFNRLYSWITDAANGLFVSSSRTDADSNDIAAGLTNCICKDGQSTPTANIPMGGFKFTNLAAGSANGDSVRWEQLLAYANRICEFRLTLTSGEPAGTTGVGSATTLYMSPYKGNQIALYDGSQWVVYSTAEISITNAGGAINTLYDVFCFANSGTPTLELLAWTNDTTRATALALQDGVLVKTGALNRRYLGTLRTNAGIAFVDSTSNRWLWNYYNRIPRAMRVAISATGYTYTTATLRQAAGNAANQLDFVMGWSEDRVRAQVTGSVRNTNVGVAFQTTIGLDSTTTRATDAWYSDGNATLVVNQAQSVNGGYSGLPGVGRHLLTWLEFSAATGTSTWNENSTYNISGEIMG